MASMVVVGTANSTRCVEKSYAEKNLSSMWVTLGLQKDFRMFLWISSLVPESSGERRALGVGSHASESVCKCCLFTFWCCCRVFDGMVQEEWLFSVICTCVKLLPPTASPENTDVCLHHYGHWLNWEKVVKHVTCRCWFDLFGDFCP